MNTQDLIKAMPSWLLVGLFILLVVIVVSLAIVLLVALFSGRPIKLGPIVVGKSELRNKKSSQAEKLLGTKPVVEPAKEVTPNYFGLQGITSFSTGIGRSIDFQNVASSAKHRVIFVGFGMTYLSRYAKKTLLEQAQKHDIDILMLDPDYIERNKEYAESLEIFLDRRGFDFAGSVRQSFETFRTLCKDWNNNEFHKFKIRLRVWKAIPSVSIVLVDPDHDSSKLAIEFFLYQSGERRPRLICQKTGTDDGLYEVIASRYLQLWESAKVIVD